MRLTTDMKEFTAAYLDTPFNAVAVKKKRYSGLGELEDFGILITPAIMSGPIADRELEDAMRDYDGVVKVRGHGWIPGEVFVWTGTAAEFNQTWRID
jgi:hypothetical protein